MSISKEAVVEKMKDSHVVVLNVLPESDFQKLHIRGSRNIPLTPDQGTFADAVEKQFGKERHFILYGANVSSPIAVMAVEALQKRGFKAEAYLSGLKDWKEAGLPMDGTKVPKPLRVSG